MLYVSSPKQSSPKEKSCHEADEEGKGEGEDEVEVMVLVERNILSDGLEPGGPLVPTDVLHPPGRLGSPSASTRLHLLRRLLLPVQVEGVDPLYAGRHLLVPHGPPDPGH